MPNLQQQAGKLDRSIRILRRNTIKDTVNQDIITYVEFHKCKAQVSTPTKTDTEKYDDAQVYALQNLVFCIRYKIGILPDMLIEYEGNEYNIKSIQEKPNTRRQWLLIEAVSKS